MHHINWDIVYMSNFLQRHGINSCYQHGKINICDVCIDATWESVIKYVASVLE